MMLWNRCPAISTAFQRVRRCDLGKGHSGEHLSDQGFDLFQWSECWEADDQIMEGTDVGLGGERMDYGPQHRPEDVR